MININHPKFKKKRLSKKEKTKTKFLIKDNKRQWKVYFMLEGESKTTV